MNQFSFLPEHSPASSAFIKTPASANVPVCPATLAEIWVCPTGTGTQLPGKWSAPFGCALPVAVSLVVRLSATSGGGLLSSANASALHCPVKLSLERRWSHCLCAARHGCVRARTVARVPLNAPSALRTKVHRVFYIPLLLFVVACFVVGSRLGFRTCWGSSYWGWPALF